MSSHSAFASAFPPRIGTVDCPIAATRVSAEDPVRCIDRQPARALLCEAAGMKMEAKMEINVQTS